jgi:G2/mitotic-specific cyclin-B, other
MCGASASADPPPLISCSQPCRRLLVASRTARNRTHGESAQAVNLAAYLTELALVDAGMLAYSYSMVSAAALLVSLTALEGTATAATDAADPGVSHVAATYYPHALARHSGYSRASVLPAAQALVRLMQKAPTASLSAVYKKYSHAKQLEVAAVPPPMSLLEESAAAL